MGSLANLAKAILNITPGTSVSLSQCAGKSTTAKLSDFNATTNTVTSKPTSALIVGDAPTIYVSVTGNSLFSRIAYGKTYTWTSSDPTVLKLYSNNGSWASFQVLQDNGYWSITITCKYTDPFNTTAVTATCTVDVGMY